MTKPLFQKVINFRHLLCCDTIDQLIEISWGLGLALQNERGIDQS